MNPPDVRIEGVALIDPMVLGSSDTLGDLT
jgi:hypothetical protein